MRKSAVLVFLIALMATPTAFAGGYDIPILYGARHLGMGGAAVADVRDAASLFHNPAGLGQMGKGMLGGNATILVGDLKSTPFLRLDGNSVTSRKTVATAPLFGFGFRIHDYITFGVAAFPVAAATGTYDYIDPDAPTRMDGSPNVIEDETLLVFIDVSPAIAINIDQIGLRMGISWRMTYVRLDRNRLSSSNSIDLKMRGWSFKSFRAGLQWRFHESVAFGLAYRHKSITRISEGRSASVLGLEFDGADARFILPARAVAGLRLDFGIFSWAGDFEYGFNSQNDRLTINLRTIGSDTPFQVPNIFEWDDQITIKTGVEIRLAKERFPIRFGFIFDGKTTTKAFPNGFGTPPVPTYTGTLGFGWDQGPFEMNFSFAYRFGKTTILPGDLGFDPTAVLGDDACAACGGPGSYRFRISAISADFSYDWE